MITIKIGYSSEGHEEFIDVFKKDIPHDITVESYLQERYFSASGEEFIPLVITFFHSFSEGMVSGLGETIFTFLWEKVSTILKKHTVLKNSEASFKLNIKNGDKVHTFKAKNVTPQNIDNALKEFGKMVIESDTNKKNENLSQTFNATENIWTSNISNSEYLKNFRDEMKNIRN